MRKFKLLFCITLIASLLVFSLKQTYGQSNDCPTYLGTQPINPTSQDLIQLVFNNETLGVGYIARVDSDNNKVFRFALPNTYVSIGRYAQGRHGFEVFIPNFGGATQSCLVGAFDVAPAPTPTQILTPTPTSPIPTLECAPGARISILDPKDNETVIGYTCSAVSTGLGIDIKTNPVDLVKSVFGVILSISGGIALILIIISGYQLIFSQGNPEAVKAAQERLTSAIVGLLFIIFSLVILQIIGANILQIPGFTK